MTSMHRWVCAIVVALLTTPILAQEYRGRVQGSLTDETQLAVPGAQVTLRNDATGVSVTRVTGPEGRYLFDYVDPGTYTLTAELSGFATVVQRNVLVQARGDVTADVTMKIAGLSETVTVETQPVAIQFNTSTQGPDARPELPRVDSQHHAQPDAARLSEPGRPQRGQQERGRRPTITGRATTWTSAAARAGATTCCSTARRSRRDRKSPTRRRWTPSRSSTCRPTRSTPSSATAPAASSACR